MELALLGNLVTAIIACTGVGIRTLRYRTFDFVDWFVGAFGILNGLGIGLTYWTEITGRRTSFLSGLTYPELSDLHYYTLLSWVLLFSVWVGAILGRQRLVMCTPRVRRTLLDARETVSMSSWRIVYTAAWVLLLAAFGLYWLYSRAYGGFAGVYAYSRLIRSGLLHLVPANPWSFLRPFGGLAFLASFLFWGLILGKPPALQRTKCYIGLVLSAALSIYVLFTRMGRLGFIVYLAVSVIQDPFQGPVMPRSLPRIALVALVSAGLLTISDDILGTGKGVPDPIAFFAKELSFPLRAFQAVLQNMEIRYMKDIVAIPLSFLPERLWPHGYATASQIITERIAGLPRGVGGVTEGIPTDIVTFSFMQLGVAGVLIVGVAWGWCLKRLDTWIRGLPLNREVVSVIYANTLLQFVVLTALYADHHHIVSRCLYLLVGISFLLVLLRVFGKQSGWSKTAG